MKKRTVLVIDDERTFPNLKPTYARTLHDGFMQLSRKSWDVVLLDHDLGAVWDYTTSPPTHTWEDIRPIVRQLAEWAHEGNPPTSNIVIVTMNPVGRHWMTDTLEGYYNVVQAYPSSYSTMTLDNLSLV